jgi:uncharacterized protein
MLTSTARWPTPHASRYLQQLCKHFAHKVEVAYDASEGRVALQAGPATLRAEVDALWVQVSAPDLKGIITARYVIDSHLVTFAHREDFPGMSWSVEPPSP